VKKFFLQYDNKYLCSDSQLLSILRLVDDLEDYDFLAVFMNLFAFLVLLATLVHFCKCLQLKPCLKF